MLDSKATLEDLPLAFLDVETTGLDPALGDRVVEIAILRCRAREVEDALQQLVNPHRPMGAGAYAVHGISDEMVADAPSFSAIADDVVDLLQDAIVIGHNTPFDVGFLLQEFSLAGRALPAFTGLDTLRLARGMVSAPSYALGRLADALGVSIAGTAHRAMADVLTTRAVFGWLWDRLCEAGADTLSQAIAAQGGPLRYRPPVTLDVPEPIREALQTGRTLWLRYRAEDGQVSERFVRPIRATSMRGRTVLMGHCLLRDARRTFRIDRIIEADIVVDGEEQNARAARP